MKKQSGFSLVELLITLAVAAIIMSVGVPSFRSMTQNNRAATQTNQLVTAFNTARSESVKRGDEVTVCASADQATCSASSNWATGWILFADAGGTAGVFDAGTDTLIKVWPALGGNTVLTSSSADSFVQYEGNGRITNAAQVGFTLSVPGCTGNNVRNIQISIQGRVRQLPRTACP
jgi:type IV fimbrial biogenesis protein FimT